MQKQIDFTDLQTEASEMLESREIDSSDAFWDSMLNYPNECIEILRFRSISQYMASKQDEQEISEYKTIFIMGGSLNRRFFAET